MTKLSNTDYDLYLTDVVLRALAQYQETGIAKIAVHPHVDAVIVVNMLDQLIYEYPEAEKIEVELCSIQ